MELSENQVAVPPVNPGLIAVPHTLFLCERGEPPLDPCSKPALVRYVHARE